MVILNSISSLFWHSLNLIPIGQNHKDSLPLNLWFFYNKRHAVPVIISCQSQQVTVKFQFDGLDCCMSFIYASNSYSIHRNLQQYLRGFSPSHPWLALGDFNAILGAHEKMGDNLPSHISCPDFSSMIDSCDLIHINYSGTRFTWPNKRAGNNMELRLDRVLCSTNWFDFWPYSASSFNLRSLRYGYFLYAGTDGPKPFRFHSMWASNTDFKFLITQILEFSQILWLPNVHFN